MKIQMHILAGSLSLVLLLSLVPMPPAEANVFLIDDFSNDPTAAGQAGTCDFSTNLTPSPFIGVDFVTTASATRLGVLGDWRICEFFIDIPSGATTAGILISAATNDVVPFDMFRHEAGAFVETMVELSYNGTDGTAASDAIPFNIDLTDSEDIRIMYSRADFQVDVTARVTDSTGDWAEQAEPLAGGTAAITNLLYDIPSFITSPSATSGVVDLTDIEEISFMFDTTTDLTDYVLEKIDITMEPPVGGTMMPASSTALLLAGFELNAIWILPAIAAIGIGAFVVSRKRK